MIFASFIGIFVIPPLYVICQMIRERIRPSVGPHKAAEPALARRNDPHAAPRLKGWSLFGSTLSAEI
jgi:hypothetical protein